MSQNSSQAGVSLHANKDVMINSDFGSDSVNHKIGDENNSGGQCFYKLCDKQKLFGYIPCGRFRDRKHALYCYLFSAMVACLFIAVIGPMVLLSLANDEINSEVVIDSTSAPNYNAWQNNVYGDGAEHIKIKYNLYYFEVQNLADTLNGARPKLMQVGPYAYDEYYVKFDITWTDGGDTVSFGTQRYYLFNQEATGPGLSQEDQITLPYTTVSGFVYLLGTIDEDQQQAIDNELHYEVETKQVELITALNEIYFVISHDTDIPVGQRILLRNLIRSTNESINILFNDVYEYMDRSDFGDMLLKTLMCKAGNLSPFWKVDPFRAWFGWLHDPLLTEMQVLLDAVANKSANGTAIPWTTAVPGAAVNWTSIEETRRRKAPDVFKTGKKNPNQVGQYVRYNNMTELWTCVVPMDSQNVSLYDPDTQFPACEHFQYEWTDEEAYNKGYRKPFATSYANRIWGSDANSFGRPITSDKLAVFISDIYRSCFLKYVEDEDWNGVTTRRFGIQSKDMENATANPANAQFYAYGPSGLENTTAASGAPVYVSFPHFLHGDPSLVAAVEGLQPNEAMHESNLDMEPQTGLLTQAHKRLQVNYQMTDKTFATTKPDTLDLAHSICANITSLVTILDTMGNMTIPLPDCNRTIFNELFTCFGTPVEWKFYNGEIFFPYGWVDETFKLPDTDADDIRDSLFFIDTFAKQLQFWSLIAAGIFLAIILAMLYRGHIDMRARGQTVWHAFDEASPATPYKRRNSRGEVIGGDLSNPIAQERAGEGYLANAGASPFLA